MKKLKFFSTIISEGKKKYFRKKKRKNKFSELNKRGERKNSRKKEIYLFIYVNLNISNDRIELKIEYFTKIMIKNCPVDKA